MHQVYMSGHKSGYKPQKLINFVGTSEQADEVFDGQNNAIEERGDVVFKNGAAYKGQWLG